MKRKFLISMALLSAMFITLNACGSKTGKTKNGLKYEILVKGEGRAAQMGDIIEGTLSLSSQDSVLFALDQPDKILQIMESIFPGDLNEGLLMLHEGDSALFYIPVDSMTKYIGGGLPDFVKEHLVYAIRVDKLYTQEELQQAEIAAAAAAQEEEAAAIARYMEENQLDIEPEESGIYFIQTKKGSGSKVQQGQTVSVNYTGKLLNGKLFDTNIEEIAKANDQYMPGRDYEPMSFPAGVGQMIPGFDQAVLMMNKGSKATVIIPFALAYGNRAIGNDIPAYSTLVFEIEVTDIQ